MTKKGPEPVSLDSLVGLQREIHGTDREIDDISSPFHYEFRYVDCYVPIYYRLDGTVSSDKVVYLAPVIFHYLANTFMLANLPDIRVKDQYLDTIRICWPPFVGSNIVPSSELKLDSTIYQSSDCYWSDVFASRFHPGGSQYKYNQMIGNVAMLTEWCTQLPSYPIEFPFSWFISLDSNYAIPLHRCTASILIQTNKYNLDVHKLLRMAQLVDGSWVELTSEDISRNMDKLVAPTKLDMPQVWGTFIITSKRDIDHAKCYAVPPTYVRDVVNCDYENNVDSGAQVSVTFKNKEPGVAFFWTAQSVDNVSKNKHSLYSTIYNTFSTYSVRNKYYEGMTDMPIEIAEHMEQWYNYPSTSIIPGINSYSVMLNPASQELGPGLVGSDGLFGFSAKLRNGDNNNSKYKILVRLMIIRKLVWEWDAGKKTNNCIDRSD